jgi:putative ABC transport system substrate-binding protein
MLSCREVDALVRIAEIAMAGFVMAALLVSASPGEAQQAKRLPQVGLLVYGSPRPAAFPEGAVVAGLKELGWVEGQNMTLLIRYAEGRPERLPDLARDLVGSKVDIIVTVGTDVARLVKNVVAPIPLVAAVSEDPVEIGLVSSLSRPGGNMTGVTFISSELAGKRLELLKELLPRARRVAILWDPTHVDLEVRELEPAARSLGVTLQSVEARTAEDLDAALRAVVAGGADALMVVPARMINLNAKRIAEFARERRLPAVSMWGSFAEAGGLMTYGPNIPAMIQRMATHVDKILKGARPGDLPIERPTRFELVVNLRTAKALGVTLPQSLLLRVDRVIE